MLDKLIFFCLIDCFISKPKKAPFLPDGLECEYTESRIKSFLSATWVPDFELLKMLYELWNCVPYSDWNLKQNKVRKRKTEVSYINTYMWNLEKWYRWTYLQSRSRDKDTENGHTDTKEGKMGWDELGDWDSHIDTTVVKSITNENLLYSTRNSTTQGSVVSWMGRKSKREGGICICMADSLWCAAGNKITLKSNCTSTQMETNFPFMYKLQIIAEGERNDHSKLHTNLQLSVLLFIIISLNIDF